MALNNKTSIQITNLTHTYSGISDPLFENFSASINDGWTAVAGNNGTGKSTLLKLITGIIEIQSGKIKKEGSSYYCRQETELNIEELEEFFFSIYDKKSDAGKIAGILNIKYEWIFKIEELNNALSEGEKKRLQIACALYCNPDILAVDEPFNHIDEDGRKVIKEALSQYNGCGLIICHDREVSDSLCSRTILIENKNAMHLTGTVSQAIEQIEFENESSRNQYRKIKSELNKLTGESANRKKAAEAADRQKSKKGIGRKDHDAKSKIDLARLSGKDGHAGKLSRQLENRIKQKEKKLSSITFSPDLKTGISIYGSRCRKDSVIRIEKGKINIGEKDLIFPELIIKPGEKISLTGNNGTGKSSLIKYILSISKAERNTILYIPQEPDNDDKYKIMNQIEIMTSEEKGKVFSNFSRLGSDAEKLIESSSPSPGEWKKLMISTGILKNPDIIILDEPLNHMDLSSIRSLEEALKLLDCAMLIVSHDKFFRNNITDIEWNIRKGNPDNSIIIMESINNEPE